MLRNLILIQNFINKTIEDTGYFVLKKQRIIFYKINKI